MRVSIETAKQQSKLFEICENKSFWIWNIEEHKRRDIRTNRDCFFNHIIGLPQINGQDKLLYEYGRITFDSLTLPS
jgi:hypothetical protein